MRLIDADSIKCHRTTECGGHGVFMDVEMVYKEEIDAIPTIEPESLRPHGEWIDRWLCNYPQVKRIPSVECSNCGMPFCDLINNHREMFRFCPYCGAKMNEGETDEAK